MRQPQSNLSKIIDVMNSVPNCPADTEGVNLINKSHPESRPWSSFSYFLFRENESSLLNKISYIAILLSLFFIHFSHWINYCSKILTTVSQYMKIILIAGRMSSTLFKSRKAERCRLQVNMVFREANQHGAKPFFTIVK